MKSFVTQTVRLCLAPVLAVWAIQILWPWHCCRSKTWRRCCRTAHQWRRWVLREGQWRGRRERRLKFKTIEMKNHVSDPFRIQVNLATCKSHLGVALSQPFVLLSRGPLDRWYTFSHHCRKSANQAPLYGRASILYTVVAANSDWFRFCTFRMRGSYAKPNAPESAPVWKMRILDPFRWSWWNQNAR